MLVGLCFMSSVLAAPALREEGIVGPNFIRDLGLKGVYDPSLVGFGRETYRSSTGVDTPHGPRSTMQSEYYLMNKGDIAHLHKLRCDQTWSFLSGSPLTIVQLTHDQYDVSGQLASMNMHVMMHLDDIDRFVHLHCSPLR